MSFYDYDREVTDYTEEERDAVMDKMSGEEFQRDVFIVCGDDVEEIYINFDSTMPCVEYNFYPFKHVLESYEIAKGDPDAFFQILFEKYTQYYDYIADDDDVKMALWHVSRPSNYVGTTKETMEGIVKEVKERMGVE